LELLGIFTRRNDHWAGPIDSEVSVVSLFLAVSTQIFLKFSCFAQSKSTYLSRYKDFSEIDNFIFSKFFVLWEKYQMRYG
jgi:hypothetical protein